MTSSSFSELFCISTHALTEGDFSDDYTSSSPPISTHALTEGDPLHIVQCDVVNISTHALTEGDLVGDSAFHPARTFQLTPSRRATSKVL